MGVYWVWFPCRMQDRDAKLQAMWKVKEKLPTENKKNLE